MKHTQKQIPNEFTVEGQIVKMTIINKKGKEYVTLFDAQDLDKVKDATNWYAQWHKDYNAYYVQGNTKAELNGKIKPQKQSLHHFLLDQPNYVSIIHINGDTLDNRRENLKLYDPTEKNEIEVLDNGVVSITLKNKLGQVDGHALIDEADLATTEGYTWVCQKKYNGQRYAVANTPQGRIYLDKLIMEPSETQYVYHINKNRLDNRRPNLELKEIEVEAEETTETK